MRKIAFILPNFETGGMASFTYRLASFLLKDYKIIFISVEVSSIPKTFNKIGEIKIFSNEWNSLYKYIKETKIEIVQYSMYRMIADVCIAAGVPIIIERMDGYKGGAILSNKSMLSAVIASTKSTVRPIRKLIKNDKIFQIYNGIDSKISNYNERDRLGFSDDQIIIGRASVLHQGKNISILIQAFKELLKIHSNIKLVIVGGNSKKHGFFDELGHLKKMCADISEHVRFTGHVDNPIPYMMGFDIFTCTSKQDNEGIPNILLEAMALRKIIISTDVDDINEIITNDYNGYLIDDGDTNGLVNSINKVIENRDSIYEKFTSNGFKIVSENFNIITQKNKYKSLYEKLYNQSIIKNDEILFLIKKRLIMAYYYIRYNMILHFLKKSPRFIMFAYSRVIIPLLKFLREKK